MTKLLTSLFAAPLLMTSVARADPPATASAMMAHVELYEPSTKQTTDHAVFITPDAEGGEIDIEGPGSATKIKVRLATRGAALTPQQNLSFEIVHSGPDRSSYVVKGELAPPPPGKRVLVAHVPQGNAPLDVLVSLTPAK